MTDLPEKSPRVTVITAVFNAESFIEPTLRSLLAQTFTDFEAIVIDDGSRDASMEVVERVAGRDTRVRIIRQENTGIAGALNRGLNESRGEFIGFLDHDDLWRPDKLDRQVEALERDETIGFVGCYSALITPDGRCLGWRFGTAARGNVYRRMLFCDLVAGGSVPLVRKKAFEAAGHFDPAPEIQGRTDWDQWIRLSRRSSYATVEGVLVGYTRSSSNFSRNYQRMANAGKAVLSKTASSDPAIDRQTLQRAQARDTFGIFCMGLADGEIATIGGLLRQSLALSWRPVMLSPRRLLVVSIFLIAKILPGTLFPGFWRVVARFVFRLNPGEPFLPNDQTSVKNQDPD